MTNQSQSRELDPEERKVLELEWSALVARARYLAQKLGYPNPFPPRNKRRQFQKEPEDQP